MVVCPDRRLSLAAQELVRRAVDDHPDTRVTVLLARRTYAPLVGRLLHDRTADKLARLISRIPGATPQIVVYDVEARIAAQLKRSENRWPRRPTIDIDDEAIVTYCPQNQYAVSPLPDIGRRQSVAFGSARTDGSRT